MKKLVSVLVAMVFLICQTTSVGAYVESYGEHVDHDEGYIGYPTSIQFKFDNGISDDLNTAFATTWTSVSSGTSTYVSAEFLWERFDDSSSGSIYLADGHDGAVTVSPPSMAGIDGDYYSVSSYHAVTYNGGTYTNNLYTFVP